MNEANHSSQPTWHDPKLAASYAKIARSVCPRCTIVHLTLVLGFGSDIRYARLFKAALPHNERKRIIWALHTYSDTNRNRSTYLTRFLRTFPTGAVWFTESAAWAQFAPPVWPLNLTRQANRTALVFRQTIAAKKRVKRLYWYEWDGSNDHTARWDSGLIDGLGRTRPAYAVAKRERFRTRLTRPQLRTHGLAELVRASRRR